MGLIKSGAWIADGITPCGWGRYSRTCYWGLSKSLDETMISEWVIWQIRQGNKFLVCFLGGKDLIGT